MDLKFLTNPSVLRFDRIAGINKNMKNDKSVLLILAVFILFSVTAEVLSADTTKEAEKIELLIARLEAMQDTVFIRNGKEHSSNTAAEHLRLKWRKAGTRVHTAEDFIELCGSRSSISDKAYQIRFADGRLEDSAVILKELLNEIEKQ